MVILAVTVACDDLIPALGAATFVRTRPRAAIVLVLGRVCKAGRIVRMDERHDLTDTQWAAIEPHLPQQKPVTGRPNRPHREVLNAINWRLRTGAPWRDLPERFGPWETVYSRFRRWKEGGVWDRILAAVQRDADARGELDWSLHLLDGTVIRAHAHAAGAKKGAAITPSVAHGVDSPPKSTCAPTETVSRSPGF